MKSKYIDDSLILDNHLFLIRSITVHFQRRNAIAMAMTALVLMLFINIWYFRIYIPNLSNQLIASVFTIALFLFAFFQLYPLIRGNSKKSNIQVRTYDGQNLVFFVPKLFLGREKITLLELDGPLDQQLNRKFSLILSKTYEMVELDILSTFKEPVFLFHKQSHPKALTLLKAQLKEKGCDPCISKHDEKFRAHVNRFSNSWAEADTEYEALQLAVLNWRQAGCPMPK